MGSAAENWGNGFGIGERHAESGESQAQLGKLTRKMGMDDTPMGSKFFNLGFAHALYERESTEARLCFDSSPKQIFQSIAVRLRAKPSSPSSRQSSSPCSASSSRFFPRPVPGAIREGVHVCVWRAVREKVSPAASRRWIWNICFRRIESKHSALPWIRVRRERGQIQVEKLRPIGGVIHPHFPGQLPQLGLGSPTFRVTLPNSEPFSPIFLLHSHFPDGSPNFSGFSP